MASEDLRLNTRTPAPFGCKYCGSERVFIELRLKASPVGSFSLSGAQLKLSARQAPYAVCDGCGHVSEGKK